MSLTKKGLTMSLIVAYAWLLLSAFLVPGSIEAMEVSIETQYSLNADANLDPGFGVKLSAGNSIFAWVSGEDTTRTLSKQNEADITLFGVGVGARKSIGSFVFRINAGYYSPESSIDGATHLVWQKQGENSSAGPYHSAPPSVVVWEHYSYDIESGFGGTLGVAYNKAITDNLSVLFGVDYRYLELEEEIIGWNETLDLSGSSYWQTQVNTDFSGPQLSLGLTYKF